MAMLPVVFMTDLFKSEDARDVERGKKGLLYLLESLVRLDQLYLKDYPTYFGPGQTLMGFRQQDEFEVEKHEEYLSKHADKICHSKVPAGRTPPILCSGVHYMVEYNTEEWQDVPVTLQRGYGDCEDLAAWRCAEFRQQKIAARPYISWRIVDGSHRFHAQVQVPASVGIRLGIRPKVISGQTVFIDDPSAKLGMYDYREELKRGPELDESSGHGIPQVLLYPGQR
jgi:hypothetical protein